ncbi:hypothetical protein IAU59_004869 [Kwoniella sp. CBS 9459]
MARSEASIFLSLPIRKTAPSITDESRTAFNPEHPPILNFRDQSRRNQSTSSQTLMADNTMRVKNEKSANANDKAVEEYFKNDSEQEMFPPSSDSDQSSDDDELSQRRTSNDPSRSSNSRKGKNGSQNGNGRKRKNADGAGDYDPDMDLFKLENGTHVEDDESAHDTDEEDDVKPDIAKKSKKAKHTTPSPTKARPKVKGESANSSPRKGYAAPRAWSGEEDWQLFQRLHPKIVKPDWSGIADIVGNSRDAKSCQNRYAVIQKRLESAIKSIGGAA